MEGAAMTFVAVNPQSLLFCSPINDSSWFSLSHSCAQMPESDPAARSNAPLHLMICLRFGRMLRNRLDLFLDFKENFPHSNPQNDTHDD
jgi:hypothetical protein